MKVFTLTLSTIFLVPILALIVTNFYVFFQNFFIHTQAKSSIHCYPPMYFT